jgi:hypothetical protein
MTETATSTVASRLPLRERLANNAGGILEQNARDYGVSTFEAVEALPASHRAIFPGSELENIMAALTAAIHGVNRAPFNSSTAQAKRFSRSSSGATSSAN